MTPVLDRGIRRSVTWLAILGVVAVPGLPSSRLYAQEAGAAPTQAAAAASPGDPDDIRVTDEAVLDENPAARMFRALVVHDDDVGVAQ